MGAQITCDALLRPINVRDADRSSGHEAMAVHVATQVVVWTLAVVACTTIIMYNPLFASLWPILTGQLWIFGTVQSQPAMPGDIYTIACCKRDVLKNAQR